MRKVYVEVISRLIINMDDGVEVGDVISEMDYNFVSGSDGADIIETEIRGFEVTDSK